MISFVKQRQVHSVFLKKKKKKQFCHIKLNHFQSSSQLVNDSFSYVQTQKNSDQANYVNVV